MLTIDQLSNGQLLRCDGPGKLAEAELDLDSGDFQDLDIDIRGRG